MTSMNPKHVLQGSMRLRSLPARAFLVLTVVASMAWGFGFQFMQSAHAASYCQVSYTVTNQWTGGFGASITVQNTGTAAWTSWSLTFAFPASGQSVTQGWNGTFTQSGQNVTVTNASYNGNV